MTSISHIQFFKNWKYLFHIFLVPKLKARAKPIRTNNLAAEIFKILNRHESKNIVEPFK